MYRYKTGVHYGFSHDSNIKEPLLEARCSRENGELLLICKTSGGTFDMTDIVESSSHEAIGTQALTMERQLPCLM